MKTLIQFIKESTDLESKIKDLENRLFHVSSTSGRSYPKIDGLSINKDGTITLRKEIQLGSTPYTKILLDDDPAGGYFLNVQMKSAKKINARKLSTLVGLPKKMPRGGTLIVVSEFLKNYEGIPRKIDFVSFNCPKAEFSGGTCDVGVNLKIHSAPNNSLSGIHRVFNSVGIALSVDSIIDRGYLNVFRIQQLPKIYVFKAGSYFSVPEYRELEKIINKHLQNDRDILECQEELISAGFKTQATL